METTRRFSDYRGAITDYRQLYRDLSTSEHYYLDPAWQHDNLGCCTLDQIAFQVARTDWEVEHRYVICVNMLHGPVWGYLREITIHPDRVRIVLDAIPNPAHYRGPGEFEEEIKYSSLAELAFSISCSQKPVLYVEYKPLFSH